MQEKKSEYRRYSIKPLKRIGAFFADLVIFMMATISLYSLAITPLAQTITPYKEYVTQQNVAFNECRNILKESHLVTFDEQDNEIKIENYFEDNLTDRLEDRMYYQDDTYVDIYLHFYHSYLSNKITFNNNQKDYSISWVNENIYKVNDESNILFALQDDNINLPLLLSDTAKKEINDYRSGEVNATSQKYHDTFIEMMKDRWEVAAELLANSDQYLSYADQYNKNADKIFAVYSYSSIIFFTIMFFLYYLLIPFLLKKGQTPAKKILHIGLFDEENNPIKFKTLLFRTLIQFVFMFFLVLFVPTMQLGFSVIYLPLIIINNYVLYLFFLSIVLLMLTIVSGIYMCSSLNHQAFHDKMLNIYVMLDNVNFDEEEPKPSNVIEQENFDRGSQL